MAAEIRARFAPSPTGYLHVGGARTALFNWLLARQQGGRFILRIEDTDQTRNIADADQKLMDDLRWLGLEWDEGPGVGGVAGDYYQSKRRERYEAAIRQLLDAEQAYYAFDTPEELNLMRQEAQAAGRNFRYPRPEKFPDATEVAAAREQGRPVVVRLKMPEQEWTVPDLILGDVTFAAGEFDDFVIQKNDGWPTYHLAVVVDDEDMQVTHVIRGKEHLMNTPKHMALQALLGYRTPAFGHLPLIFNPDGSKMSKRDKDKAVRNAYQQARQAGDLTPEEATSLSGCADAATFDDWLKKNIQLSSGGLEALAKRLGISLPEIDVHDFRKSGYLPEVLVNFLALLGWSAGDDREHYAVDELVSAFDIRRVKKTDARFDRDKLLSFNTDACAAADEERLLVAFQDYLRLNPESPLAGVEEPILRRVIGLCAGLRTFPDIELKAGRLFIPVEELDYDEAAVKKWLLKGDRQGVTLLNGLRERLAVCDDWSPPALDAIIRQFAEEQGVGLGKVAQPLRIAAAGAPVSPAIDETLDLVGQARMLERIDRLLSHVEAGA
jgi:glutamyl-tRNA synthetase